MKSFSYAWEGEIFILHLQFNGDPGDDGYEITVKRMFQGDRIQSEVIRVRPGDASYRFMVSRTHPKETGFLVEYPHIVMLEAFELDDRAYYPTESFFRG